MIIALMDPSTPASRIPRWRSRIKGAWLMQVGGMPIQSIMDVRTTLERLKQEGRMYCDLLMAHAELRDGLTQDGIPQVNIDQLNTRFLINMKFIDTQQVPMVASGGVYN